MTDDDDGDSSRPVSDQGQLGLIEQTKKVLSRDDRVVGLWLAGSFGRGTNDQFSDVDLLVVVDPGDVEGFCAAWPRLCDRIAPTLLRRQLGSSAVFNQVTTDWLRFDVSVVTPAALTHRTRSTVTVVYDPLGLSAGLAEPGPPKQPNPGRVELLSTEFLRVLGLLPVVLGRGEFVVGQSGAGLLRTMVIDMMLEDVAVEDRGGVLHLSRLLPGHRLQLLTDLPAMSATRASVIDAHVACASVFLPLARDLHDRCGLVWPQELEDATRRHLSRSLSIAMPDSRSS